MGSALAPEGRGRLQHPSGEDSEGGLAVAFTAEWVPQRPSPTHCGLPGRTPAGSRMWLIPTSISGA